MEKQYSLSESKRILNFCVLGIHRFRKQEYMQKLIDDGKIKDMDQCIDCGYARIIPIIPIEHIDIKITL